MLSNKYTDEQIRTMVDFVIDAKLTNNPLYPQFLMVMSMMTNLDPHEIERRLINCQRTGQWL